MMRVAEAFARQGHDVEFWVPNRVNPDFTGVDPFEYHAVEKNFSIRYMPVLDLMYWLPGRIGFFLMLASFTTILLYYVVSHRKNTVFYFFDVRDAWSTLLVSNAVFSEIHMYYRSSVDVINRWGFSRCAGLIVATRVMMDDIHARYKVPQERMIHAPVAVNSERFAIDVRKEDARAQLGLPLEGRMIFYIGHLFPVKGVDVLFDTHRSLAPEDVIYFIGGTDGDIARFTTKWVAAGRPSNVVVAGRKPHQEVPLWLRAADILVIPNTAKDPAGSIESSPSKLVEYMASGRPIIASDVPAIRDILDDTMGYFVTPDSPEAIAEAVRNIANDPHRAELKGEAARFIARSLSWSARARKILTFIERRMRAGT